jgi:uncharacterized protein YqfA (UPF0365 family)
VKRCRSKWFINTFVASFGGNYDGSISKAQSEIFQQYLEYVGSGFGRDTFKAVVGEFIVTLIVSQYNHNATLNIRYAE